MLAALQHTRGAHDAGGKIIHNTPKKKRPVLKYRKAEVMAFISLLPRG